MANAITVIKNAGLLEVGNTVTLLCTRDFLGADDRNVFTAGTKYQFSVVQSLRVQATGDTAGLWAGDGTDFALVDKPVNSEGAVGKSGPIGVDGFNPDDAVDKPKHYQVVGNTRAENLINVMLAQYVKDNPDATPYQIFCAGNIFKYRLRVGNKDCPKQELGKIRKFGEMHDEK